MKDIAKNMLYTVCQQCNTNCGIGVCVEQGRVVKLKGNPYSPWTMDAHIPYDTPLQEAQHVEGALCPKGYAGMQTLYDPYRIKKVLKRVGKRGENRWKSMDFHKAVQEIVQGGDLFGEGYVEGLQHIATLRDPKLAEVLAADAKAVAEKKLSVEDFKVKHAEHLHHLIDADHPDLGPKNNQICYMWGRQKGGRAEFAQRFFRQGLGTVNTHGHTTVCQGSLYFTCKAMSEQFCEGSFSGGKKFYWQADTNHAAFILFVGANPLEANYGPTLRAGKITRRVAQGQLRMAVADPRFSKTAARAWKWIPLAPHGVGALGMGMIRWILENQRFDAPYLQACNKAAAKRIGEPTWTQAAWLVKLRPDGSAGTLLRASDLGQSPEARPVSDAKKEATWNFDAFVTLQQGETLCFDPNDTQNPVQGNLFVDTMVQGHRVKSVLQLYKEAAEEQSLEQWAEQAGTTAEEIAELAREFTSHGKKAAVDIHRGVSQHTNGFYTVTIWMLVNMLIGNVDWKGGLCKATTYATTPYASDGPKATGPVLLETEGSLRPWGISIIRHGVHYEKTTLFEGYPAKRPWFPFASDIYQEIIPSAGDAYPYPLKALFMYMAAPTYSLPAGHALMDILRHTAKIPLVVASDITVGETSMYADYIFPDVTYLERWEFSGSHPSQACKVAPVRQPVVAPQTDTVTVYGQSMPITWEATLLALAQSMQLPVFGEHALGQHKHLRREEDLYLRMVAGIAHGEAADGSQRVPAACAQEIELFTRARSHLPASTFDAARWERVVGAELWPHVVTVLNRGGRFESMAAAYDGERMAHGYGKMVNIFFENVAHATHSMTGQPLVAYGRHMLSPVDCLGRTLKDAQEGYDLTLITYKTITQCKTRTAGNTWLRELEPENYVELAAMDAVRMGLVSGDRVRIVSASNPQGVWAISATQHKYMEGKVRVTQGLRPGVVAFSLGYGHWANGAADMCIDGQNIAGDARRATGFHGNAAMRLDPILKNTGLEDTVGGSAVFYQTSVKLVKL